MVWCSAVKPGAENVTCRTCPTAEVPYAPTLRQCPPAGKPRCAVPLDRMRGRAYGATLGSRAAVVSVVEQSRLTERRRVGVQRRVTTASRRSGGVRRGEPAKVGEPPVVGN
jgi:hypothetical protein